MPRASTILTGCALLLTAAPAYAGTGIQPLDTDRVASGLDRPVFATHAGDEERLFIVEQTGAIKILNLDTETVNGTPFLDIDPLVAFSSGNDERGLLGLAFHPSYPDVPYFYVYYSNNSSDTVVARYQVSANPDVAMATGTTLQIIDQPFTNHNGGWIDFSPVNGYLYIATGDGGSGGDPGNRAQDITNQPLGKMLRKDVGLNGLGYSNPPSNPFVGVTGDDDIWAYGLRNPWRCAFDKRTGDIYMADVGQNAWEEINRERAQSTGGVNYGWRCREGAHNFNFGGNCANETLIDPIWEYSQGVSNGFSITGGYVYRGCDIPDLQGTYFYADFIIQNIWTFKFRGSVQDFTERTSELSPSIDGQTVNQISSFGEDARGEMYICDRGGATSGQVFKIIPATPRAQGDVDLDGLTNVNDLVAVIENWGDCSNNEPCLTDLVLCDHKTDVNDLVDVIKGWSP